MTTVADIQAFFESFAPVELAEGWDNVGLLIGRATAPVEKVITCLTLTSDVADEAIREGAQIIITHHPVMFRPVQQVTDTTIEGRMLLRLMESRIAVYSPHTRFDSAAEGINQRLATSLGLTGVSPLIPAESDTAVGAGRWGKLPHPVPLSEFLSVVRAAAAADYLEYVGSADATVSAVGVACGAAAGFLKDAIRLGCDAFVTGEARFHDAVDARSHGVCLILTGHYSSERPAMEQLAVVLAETFPQITVSPSRVEADPLKLYRG